MDIIGLDLESSSHCDPGIVSSGQFGYVGTRECFHGTSVLDHRRQP
jgi:hypothetical protein